LTDFTATRRVLFTDLEKRPVVLAFDQLHGSSDGGAILLSAASRRFGDGFESLSRGLQDARQQGKVDHPLTDLMRQRIYGLGCCYEDATNLCRCIYSREPIPFRDMLGGAHIRMARDGWPVRMELLGRSFARSIQNVQSDSLQ